MKKILALMSVLALAIAATAQTLNVKVGSVNYQFPASQTGDMTYTGGTQLTIMGKTFTLTDISAMTIDNSDVTDSEISVVYDGTSATVNVAGNIARYVEPEVSGAHVSITQSSDLAEEITYSLSGSSSDGEFYMAGSYKATIELDGLTLTNANPVYNGAAVGIKNGKRIAVSVKKGTENTLTDAASSTLDQKAALYVKGHLELKGKGTLNVYGNYAHGIKAGEYVEMKNCTVNVLKAVKDGINCNEYFLIASGTLNVSGTGDDGIQCDIDGTSSTGETTDHEDEDSGNIYLEGGTITVKVTAQASKGIKAAGDMRISGDETIVNVTTTGNGYYDSSERDAKGCGGLKTDGNMTIAGGTLTLSSTGTGGKCIKSDGTLTISGGTISASSTGSIYKYSNSYTASPKAIKSMGAMTISGGTVMAKSTNHEAIESKSTITITDGYVYAEAGDDAINSAGDFTISGGYVMGNSTGNDGLDANGNFYIKGGNVFAIGTTSPELGIDANTEQNKKLYITGGNIVAIGGLESGSSISNGTAKQASSYSKGSTYALYNGSTLAFAFKVPSNSRMGTSMVVYTTGTPDLKSGATGSGTTYWNGYGYTSASGGSSVTLSTYSSNSGGPGGGNQGGPGGRR